MKTIEFPTVVYRTPGTHQCAGGTYGYVAAETQDQFDQLIAEGWFPSLQEAIGGETIKSSGSAGEGRDAFSENQKIISLYLVECLETLGVEINPASESPSQLIGELLAYAAPYADSPQPWLLEKAKSLGLEAEDDLTSDELLFLICHEYAKPAEEEDLANGGDDDNSPPTREELEAKAKELGINFDGRTTDKSLAEKIEHVLGEQE